MMVCATTTTTTTTATPSALKRLITRLGITQAHLAKPLGMSCGSLADLVNHGHWPQRRAGLKAALAMQLLLHGATRAQVAAAVKPPQKARVIKAKNPQRTSAGGSLVATKSVATATPVAAPKVGKAQPQKVGLEMLLRKHTINEAARKAFGLARDPFTDDVQDATDVFTSKDVRYVRETLWATAKHGGLLALVGESGCGKSTLRRDLVDRAVREQSNMIFIEPYVLAMEESDTKGKTLKSAHIAEALIAAVAPLEKPKRSPEARFAQLHRLLKDSRRSGNKHILVIEEAHCLPTATLKHLKRFFELEDGFKRLLAIVLVGQPELRQKLSEKNAEVREVVQRCEVVELAPLDNCLAEYVAFKFKRLDKTLADVFEPQALDALRAKLGGMATTGNSKNRSYGSAAPTSLLYPLAVANVIAAAMNEAAALGAPLVSASIIQEV